MNKKQNGMKIIAFFLAIVLGVTIVPVLPVHVLAEDQVVSDVALQAKREAEKIAETVKDEKSSEPAGDWKQVKKDGLARNAFHNEVQKYIEENYSKTEKEKRLKIKKKGKDEKEVEKDGRADIYMEIKTADNATKGALWEVKPWSYRNPQWKRNKALRQLGRYVSSNTEFVTGSLQIKDGEAKKVKLKVKDENHVEVITYKIPYYIESDGLIFYKFTRSSEEVEMQEQEQEQSASATDDLALIANGKAIYDIADNRNDRTQEQGEQEETGQESQPEPVLCIDVSDLMFLRDMADKWMKFNMALESHPDSQNSASPAIIAGCRKFLSKTEGVLYYALRNPQKVSAAEAGVEMDISEVNGAIGDFETIFEMFGGDWFTEHYMQEFSWNAYFEKIYEMLIKSIQNEMEEYIKAGQAQPPRDPLIIDLGEEGIVLHNVKNGVNFDLDNNGFAEKTAWIGSEDGFLALDRNENGKIDNGGELFGDQVLLQDGTVSESGFEALGELDENSDGKIDAEDAVYDRLFVWMDADQNGKSKAEELKSLEELGIMSISLQHEKNSIMDEETGIRVAESSTVSVKQKDDTVMETKISEFWFPVNSSDTTHENTVTAGNVPDLNSALRKDETGRLFELCEEFVESDNVAYKRICTKEILYLLTGASDIKPGSRGGNIDARDLKVVEEFMGQNFNGVGGSSPNVNAAKILKEIYGRIEDTYYTILNMKASLGIYQKISSGVGMEENNTEYRSLPLRAFIQIERENEERQAGLVYDFGIYLRSFDAINKTRYYEEFLKEYNEMTDFQKEAANYTKSGGTYIGTEGSDSYQGTSENEAVHGKGGDDTLSGGSGNDGLFGGAGNDTYIFSRGFGKDTILDNSGQNIIRFSGLEPGDILVNGTGENDVTIKVRGTSDTLTIKDFCKEETYQDFMLEFSKTRVYATAPDSPFRYILGNSTDDTAKTVLNDSAVYGLEGNDRLYGSDGADIIYGNEGDDHIYAAGGDDIVLGGDGRDLLDAGEGNDRLYGGAGDDTYLFSKGYGTDVIEDREGITMIRLDEEITEEDLSVCSFGENAVITINNTDDHMILSGYKGNEENYLMEVQGNMLWIGDYIKEGEGDILEGTVQGDYIENKGMKMVAGNMETDRIIGTTEDEWIFGDGGDDQLLAGEGRDVIYAGEGKDAVFGNEGNDHIDGGSGNDYLEGGKGDDTYLFYPESGNDSIRDFEGENTIVFGDGIYSDKLTVKRSNWNDLKIYFDGLEDTLTIKDYCVNEEARDFLLVFADGTIVRADDAKSPLKNIVGEEEGDYMEDIYQNGITLNGKDGNDNLDGKDGNDSLSGGNGDDRLSGKNGNDTLDGGTGNDYMDGGAGDDTYIFGNGYGKDTIHDSEGTNTIKIHGFMPEQMKASRTNWNDLTISFDGCEDQLVIEGFCIAENNRNFYLVFDNGRRMHADEKQGLLRTLYGTGETESIFAIDNKGNTIYGEAGNDYISGGNGADRLYGEEGEDQLWARAGDDILDGGTGDDVLYGEAGNDIYEFGLGYGKDTIVDSEGINTISFGSGITPENLKFHRTDWNNLTIILDGTEEQDQLVLRDFFVSEDSCKYHVNFADGIHYNFDNEENPLGKFREQQLGNKTVLEIVETDLTDE